MAAVEDIHAPHSEHVDTILESLLSTIQNQMGKRMRQEQGQQTDLRICRSASGTAKYTMYMRYLAHCMGAGPDSLAQHFLALFWSSEWPKEWEQAYTSSILLGFRVSGRLVHDENLVIYSTIFSQQVATGIPEGTLSIGYNQCRTAFFDSVVAAHAAMPQLVVLGAGFDTRCYRLTDRPERCFEVDAPSTQADKRETLAAAGIDTSDVVFVSTNFAGEDNWMDDLLAAGFDLSLPTLFLWEGVTYLSMLLNAGRSGRPHS